MDDIHIKKADRVTAEVKKFYKVKKPFYIYHGSTNATRQLSFKRESTIDTSDLNEVLGVDSDKRVAVVEPNVPMDSLVKATLQHGLVPSVVMEFPGITVGGGFQGGAGESSSYKHGLFNNTCNWIDMVLANGTMVRASPIENRDLYFGSAGSFGSLGIIMAAEVQLIPARKYVSLTYVPVTSFKNAVEVLNKVSNEKNYDYIDGIMFSSSNGVIMLGNLTDEKIGKIKRFTRAHDDWFYLHAQKISGHAKQYTNTIPLVDYLFRYDRGAFWVGRYAYERAHWPFNRFTRWLVDPIMKTRKLYEALHESGASDQYVIQDLALPSENIVKFMEFIDKKFGTYPLWLCPLKLNKESPLLCSNINAEHVINVGVWDNHPIRDYDKFVAANQELESTLTNLGGQKWFYAHAYYTEEEFWNIYDKHWYRKLRKKYHAETLPDVYEKVRTKGHKKVTIRRASMKTVLGLAKLRISQ